MAVSTFRSIDHVMVRVKEAEPFMQLFEATLGLPVSWPLRCSDFATYGWVTVGNANLEFWAAADNSDLPVDAGLPLFHGMALEPDVLGKSLGMLAERGIVTKPPQPYVTRMPDGRPVTNFTNAVVSDLSTDACCIFFCEWGDEGTIFPWTEKRTTAERKAIEQSLLSACAGGHLGITGLVEVRMTTPNVAEYEWKWKQVAGPSMPIRLGPGVTLSMRQSRETVIESIVLGVRSLDGARRFLREIDLLGEDLEDEISLSEGACSALQFRFRQSEAILLYDQQT